MLFFLLEMSKSVPIPSPTNSIDLFSADEDNYYNVVTPSKSNFINFLLLGYQLLYTNILYIQYIQVTIVTCDKLVLIFV